MKPELPSNIPSGRSNILLYPSRLIFLLLTILGVLLFASLFFFLDIGDILKAFRHLRPPDIIILILVDVVIMSCGAFRWQIVVSSLGGKVPLLKLILYRYPITAVNYTVPTPGIAGQAVGILLLRRDGMPYKAAAVAMLLDVLIATHAAIIFGMAFLAAWGIGNLYHLSQPLLIAIAAMGCVFASIVSLLPVFLFKRRSSQASGILEQSSYDDSLPKTTKGKIRWLWEVFLLTVLWAQNHPVHFARILAFNFLIYAVILLQIVIVFSALGVKATFFDAGVMQGFFAFSFLTPTWQDIGGFETAGAFSASWLGYTRELGLSIALVLRFIKLLAIAFGYLVLIAFGLRGLKKSKAFTADS